jgi:hypothetical protein
MMIKHLFIPLDRFDSILTICMGGLLSNELVSAIIEQTGCDVEVYIGTISDVRRALLDAFPDYYDPITQEPRFDMTMAAPRVQQDFEATEELAEKEFSKTMELQELVEEDYDWEALFEEAEREVMKELQNRKEPG